MFQMIATVVSVLAREAPTRMGARGHAAPIQKHGERVYGAVASSNVAEAARDVPGVE